MQYLVSSDKKFENYFFGENAWSAKNLPKFEFWLYDISRGLSESFLVWQHCVKRWASSEARFLRYCVLKFEKHKIKQTEKTAFKVKSSFFYQFKVIKSKFAFQTLKQMVIYHHKQFYWTKQSENSLLKAFHRLFFCIIYTFFANFGMPFI